MERRMAAQRNQRFADRRERRRQQVEAWSGLIADILPASAAPSFSCRSVNSICTVLRPFLEQRNIAFWYPDGYRILTDAMPASEIGCIELRTTCEAPCIVRPLRLSVERIDEDFSQSFLSLELDELTPLRSPATPFANFEGVWEIIPGNYFCGSEFGELEAELDDDRHSSARFVTRWFGGHILIVSPGSLLNSVRRGSDGCYTALDALQVREFIETVLARIRH